MFSITDDPKQKKSRSGEVKVQNTDMSDDMLQEAIRVAQLAIARYKMDVDIAKHIKEYFDDKYSPVWNCIVGKNFGVFVTHQASNFAHFYVGSKAVVLFKGL